MSVKGWAQAVGVLAGTVLEHEVAHAVAALRAGGRVREVGVGFGPVLVRGPIGGVDVSLRPILLGGFAAIETDALPHKKRRPVLLAGPLANIIAGVVLRVIAGSATPVALPGQRRPVEAGGVLAALTMLTRAAASGSRTLLRAASDINLSVGMMNLLPVMPLDGGHLAAAELEAAGASRTAVAAFRHITAALFLSFAVSVLLSDLGRLRVGGARPSETA